MRVDFQDIIEVIEEKVNWKYLYNRLKHSKRNEEPLTLLKEWLYSYQLEKFIVEQYDNIFHNDKLWNYMSYGPITNLDDGYMQDFGTHSVPDLIAYNGAYFDCKSTKSICDYFKYGKPNRSQVLKQCHLPQNYNGRVGLIIDSRNDGKLYMYVPEEIYPVYICDFKNEILNWEKIKKKLRGIENELNEVR